MRHRSTVRRLIALAAVLVAVSLWSIPNGSGAQEGASSLRVMTYNIKHGQGNDDCDDATPAAGDVPAVQCAVDLDRTTGVIEALDPDIAAIQEVDRFWARSGGIDQTEELGNDLDMETCFAANLDHGPDNHADEDHEYGTLILSRFPILSCENTLLPTEDGWEPRGLLEARIDVDEIGEVAVLGTHLQSNRRAEEEEAARLRTEQVDFITERVASIDVPLVLMGDLNAEPDDPELEPLFAPDGGLEDAWTIAGVPADPDSTPDTEGFTVPAERTGDPENQIDYIFAAAPFTFESAEVVIDEETRMASDHYPVVADLTLIEADSPSGTDSAPLGEDGDGDDPPVGDDGDDESPVSDDDDDETPASGDDDDESLLEEPEPPAATPVATSFATPLT